MACVPLSGISGIDVGWRGAAMRCCDYCGICQLRNAFILTLHYILHHMTLQSLIQAQAHFTCQAHLFLASPLSQLSHKASACSRTSLQELKPGASSLEKRDRKGVEPLQRKDQTACLQRSQGPQLLFRRYQILKCGFRCCWWSGTTSSSCLTAKKLISHWSTCVSVSFVSHLKFNLLNSNKQS